MKERGNVEGEREGGRGKEEERMNQKSRIGGLVGQWSIQKNDCLH